MASPLEDYVFPLRCRATTFPLDHRHDDEYLEPPSPMTVPPEYPIAKLSYMLRAHTLNPISASADISEIETCSSASSSLGGSPPPSPVPAFSTSFSFSSASGVTASITPAGAYHTRNLRQQRQRALRRQCSPSHLREIRALVDRMTSGRIPYDTQSSCSSDTGSVVADDDEDGMDVDGEDDRLSEHDGPRRIIQRRRSCDLGEKKTERCLVRDVRIQKRSRNRGVSRVSRS